MARRLAEGKSKAEIMRCLKRYIAREIYQVLCPMPRHGSAGKTSPRPLDIYRSINPYSESQFRTLKYRPDFPDTFGCIEDARAFCQRFFRWYNTEHGHSGIAWHTPSNVHHGHAGAMHAVRAEVLAAAYTRNPERFVRKHPQPAELPTAAWINKPPDQDQQRTHSTNP